MGDELSLAWGAAALAAVLAAFLAVRVATESRRTSALRDQLEELRSDAKAGRKQQEKREKGLRRAESELEKATRKLAQAEKRAAQMKESARSERAEGTERVRELEAQLAAQRGGADSLSSDLERTRGELDAAVAHVARAETRLHALEQEAEARPPPADPEELRALRERAESAEQKLSERDEALAGATRQLERLREKARTQETLYTSIRSELSVKKDQIRQQREEIERLRATKVALGAVDPD